MLGQKYGEIFPRHVLVVLAKTKNRDFGLRQNKTTILTSKGGQMAAGGIPGQAGNDENAAGHDKRWRPGIRKVPAGEAGTLGVCVED